jgi:hypothetical protein
MTPKIESLHLLRAIGNWYENLRHSTYKVPYKDEEKQSVIHSIQFHLMYILGVPAHFHWIFFWNGGKSFVSFIN